MPTSTTNRVIEQLRRSVPVGDAALLVDFIERRDETALAAIIHRHGPMVWGVCRRSLSHHDAEDAFQATFLVLVRKAASVTPRELLGNWLYGVAHRTALHARRTVARRKTREKVVNRMPEPETVPHDPWSDGQPLLDEELSRLPEIYRAVIVLCELEGRTRKEVALQLKIPEGTVAGRLARGRALLAKRLTQRGATLAAAMSSSAASATLPNGVLTNTIEAATSFAAGPVAGAISPNVADLTEGVLKAMLMSKLKAATAIVLVLGFAFTGATGYIYRNAKAEDAKPAEVKPTPAAQKGEKLAPATEAKLKWGEPVNGLRAAMAIRLAPGRAKGDKPDLYIALQNVSKEPIRITDADVPMDVNLRMLRVRKDGEIKYGLGTRQPVMGERLLQPREVTYLSMFDPDIKLTVPTVNGDTVGSDHAGEALNDTRLTFNGEFTIEKAPAKAWTGKLVTGESGGAAAEIKSEPAPEKKPEPEKESITAWGKEVGGLQAGIGFRAGEKRPYSHGETVKLVVRVRNVGKEAAKFSCFYPYFTQSPPTVTDGEGKPFVLEKVTTFGLPVPEKLELAAGKVIELTELKYNLKPASAKGEGDRNYPGILKGIGKFHIQYSKLAEDAESILGKLATGKLELEIKPEPPKASKPDEVYPTQDEMRLLAAAKSFCVAMRNHHGDKNANALREYIDPRYLEKHGLKEGDLSIPMLPVGSVFDLQIADDGLTIYCVVGTGGTREAPIKEVLVLKMSEFEGKGGIRYLAPPKAPDAKTGSFAPWILRAKL